MINNGNLKSFKDRNLSTIDYLEILQMEYIVAELRYKIYKNAKDKAFYLKVMNGKKFKIEDINKRNSLPTIFNDDVVKEKYYKQIYLNSGFPKFMYVSEKHRLDYQTKDFDYYYTLNCDFKISLNNTVTIGKLKSINKENNEATLLVENKLITILLDKITRII